MKFFGTLALAVAALATVAYAGDTSAAALGDATALAKDGKDLLKAAERFGDAIALAQSAHDLQAEQAAADAFERFYDGVDAPAEEAGSDIPARPTRSSLLAAVMLRLDARRCGAFVSAPVLARALLLRATEFGSVAYVADAARVAGAHATKAASGRAAAVVAKYAEGLKSVADGKFDAAAPMLDVAASEAVTAGWTDLAAHAATEAAAAWVRASAPDQAAASLGAVVAAAGPKPVRRMVRDWKTFADRRLADAPAAVRKPLDDLAEGLGGGSASAAGGAGGAGGRGAPAGTVPTSDIAKFLGTIGGGKPFVSVACSAKGLEPRWTTSKTRSPREFDDGIRVVNEGGVTLLLHERSVALRMVDLTGTRGQPGESQGGAPAAARAFYLLADGETWNVSKDGVVTIAR